jgi:hypothetical protein
MQHDCSILYIEDLVDRPALFRTSNRQIDFITNIEQAVEILYHLVLISLEDACTTDEEDKTLLTALLWRTEQYVKDRSRAAHNSMVKKHARARLAGNRYRY